MKWFLFLLLAFLVKNAGANFNSRIPIQGYLKYAGAPLNSAAGFPIKFIIKKNGTTTWCQTSASPLPVVSGVLSSVLSGVSNCQSLSNTFDSNLFLHSADSDQFSFDVVVDVASDGFNGGDDTTFSGIDLLPTPLALHANHSVTADGLTSNLSILKGGTGATTATQARTNLGLGSLSVLNLSGNASEVLFGNGNFATIPLASLSGDLSGTTAAASVLKIQGRAVSSMAPSAGQILAWNAGASTWAPTSLQSSDIADASTTNSANKIVIRDSLGNFSAGTITANLAGTATNVTGTVAVVNGGTGATDPASARTNLGAAKSGVNTDISSISGAAMQSSAVVANASAGTTTAYTLTNTPPLNTLSAGQTVFLRINATNTGVATLNVDGLGAKNIFSALTNAAVAAGDLRTSSVVQLTYDGTQWLAQITPQFFSATALNCGTSVAANNSVVCPNIAAATALAGDLVQCSPSADPSNTAGKVTWSAFTTAGNISIRFACSNNTTACAITSRNWKCIVFK